MLGHHAMEHSAGLACSTASSTSMSSLSLRESARLSRAESRLRGTLEPCSNVMMVSLMPGHNGLQLLRDDPQFRKD